MLQALRQTLLKKYARIRTEMDNLHNKRMSPYEKIEALESIRCQIQGSWRTDEIRRQKPTPQVQFNPCLQCTTVEYGSSVFPSHVMTLDEVGIEVEV